MVIERKDKTQTGPELHTKDSSEISD